MLNSSPTVEAIPDGGVLSHAEFLRTLAFLREDLTTGVLEVRAECIVTLLYFLHGTVVFAEEGTLGETLGRMLLRNGVITEQQHSEIIERMTDTLVESEQLRFGEVAIGLGILSKDQVEAGLAAQVREKVMRCIQWDRLECVLRDTPEAMDEVSHFPCELEPLVVEGLRRYSSRERVRRLWVPVATTFPVLRERPSQVVERFRLTRGDEELLGKLNGTRTCQALVDGMPAGDGRFDELLAALVVMDAVDLRLTRVSASPERYPGPPPPESVARPEEVLVRGDYSVIPSEIPSLVPSSGQSDPLVGRALCLRPASPWGSLSSAIEGVLPPESLPPAEEANSESLSGSIPPQLAACSEAPPIGGSSPPVAFASIAPTQDSSTPTPQCRASAPPESDESVVPTGTQAQPLMVGTVPPIDVREVEAGSAGGDGARAARLRAAARRLRRPRVTVLTSAAPKEPDAPVEQSPSMPSKRNSQLLRRARVRAEQLFNRGKRLLNEGNLVGAAQELERATRMHTGALEYQLYATYARFCLETGSADRKLQQVELAELVDKALAQDKRLAFAHVVKGHLAMMSGDEEVARRAFKTGLELDPSDVHAQRYSRMLNRNRDKRPKGKK